MALSLVACGGGAEEPPAPEGEAAAPPPVAAPPAAADPNPIADRSAEESDTFEPFPSGEDIPEPVADRIVEKQPMLMLFVDESQKDTNDVRDEVAVVVKNNRGRIDLLTYDVGKYSNVTKGGTVEVDAAKLDKDPKAQESVMLARAVGVTFTPYILIVDDQGYIIYRHSGYVDSELLERQVLRVTD
jgi:hypothetical protein